MKKVSTLDLLFVAIMGVSPAAFAADLIDVSKLPSKAAQGAPGPVTLQAAVGAGGADELKAIRSTTLPNGKQVTRYEQFHNGVRVVGEAITEVKGPGKSVVAQRSGHFVAQHRCRPAGQHHRGGIRRAGAGPGQEPEGPGPQDRE